MTNIVKLINILTTIISTMVEIMEDPVKEIAALGGKGIRKGLSLGKDGLVNSLNSFDDPNPGTAKISGMLAITGLVAFLTLQAYKGMDDNTTPTENTRLYAPILRTEESENSQNEGGFPYKTLAALTGATLLGAGAVLGTQRYRNRSRDVSLENMPEVRDAVQGNYRH